MVNFAHLNDSELFRILKVLTDEINSRNGIPDIVYQDIQNLCQRVNGRFVPQSRGDNGINNIDL